MGIKKNVADWRFGRLRAMRRAAGRPEHWECLCDCGKESEVRIYNLLNGITRSCGCLKNELTIQRTVERMKSHPTRGLSKSKIYMQWSGMKARCENSAHIHFEYYGGRGISVCERWQTFGNFLEDMGYLPPGMTLDRIENDLGYLPGNCRWATRKEQANNKRGNHLIAVGDETMTLRQASEKFGINYSTFCTRIAEGWPIEKAILSGRQKHWQLVKRPRAKRTPKSHCKRGHELKGDNVYLNRDGLRQCKVCRAMHSKNRKK